MQHAMERDTPCFSPQRLRRLGWSQRLVCLSSLFFVPAPLIKLKLRLDFFHNNPQVEFEL